MELRLKALKEKGVAVSEIGEYLAKWQDPAVTREVSDALIAALEKAEPTEEGAFVLQNKEYLTKKSVWAFGGDGWAYRRSASAALTTCWPRTGTSTCW